MSLLCNILWIIFGGGFVICIEYLFGGVVLCATIVGIPFGLQCFKIAIFGLMPFGKTITEEPGSSIGCVLNVIWILCAGIWIFLSHLALALSLAVTIVGIPFAWQHLKLARLALAPFGVQIRS